jgi:hypothetical protein
MPMQDRQKWQESLVEEYCHAGCVVQTYEFICQCLLTRSVDDKAYTALSLMSGSISSSAASEWIMEAVS